MIKYFIEMGFGFRVPIPRGRELVDPMGDNGVQSMEMLNFFGLY